MKKQYKPEIKDFIDEEVNHLKEKKLILEKLFNKVMLWLGRQKIM